MIKLYTPSSDLELAMIKSLFEAEGIDYYVENDHFGTISPIPSVGLYRAKTICVPEELFQEARDLLTDFLPKPEQPDDNWKSEYSLWDRVKMAVDTVLFGGMVLPRRNRKP